MNKTEWDAMEREEKDDLILTTVLGGEIINDPHGLFGCKISGVTEEGKYKISINKAFSNGLSPRYTTDRNACALVEEEIKQKGRVPEYAACLLEYLLCYGPLAGSDITVEWRGPMALLVGVFTNHEAGRLVMAIRGADPDLCCYCAVRAMEMAAQL